MKQQFQFAIILLLLALFANIGQCEVRQMERSNDLKRKEGFILPEYGIEFHSAYYAVAKFQAYWDDYRHVICISVRPSELGLYNVCLCDLSAANGNESSEDGEAQAENCLANCQKVDEGAFEGSVQKFNKTIDEKHLKYFEEYAQTYWNIPFSIGHTSEMSSGLAQAQISKLMFCINKAHDGKVYIALGIIFSVKNLICSKKN